jgi:NDP-sugar pyrophosphorylase family protein
VILAGGRGTRLAPFTSVLPKPLMPLGDRSVLEIVVGQLARSGFLDITLSVGYLSHLIRAVFDNRELHRGEPQPVEQPSVRYVHEDEPLGTVGPLRLVEGLEDSFLVMNGDLLTDLDYMELFSSHRSSGCALTIATKRRETRLDYGVLHLGTSGSAANRVVRFEEKPTIVADVSMGIYIMEPSVLDLVPTSGAFDIPDLVHALLAAEQPVGAFPYDGPWFDIGRPDDYERAATAWSNNPLTFLNGRAQAESLGLGA